MDIKKVLAELGLGEKKAKVYLACLELGAATASQVAEHAQIQRTTAYEILEYLLKQGLISSVPKSHGTLFLAEPPEQLIKLLDEKKKKLDKILPELQSFFNASAQRPSVRFYEGIEGVRSVFMDTLASGEKHLRSILSITDLYDFIGKDWFHTYTAQRIASGAKLSVIRSESKEVGSVFPSSTRDNRELRFAPRGMEFSMSHYVYAKKVALISTAKEGYGMIIESQEFYQTQLHLFSRLWDVCRNTKKAD